MARAPLSPSPVAPSRSSADRPRRASTRRRPPGLGLGDERIGDEPLAEVDASCPFCGAAGSLLVDVSGGRVQSYVEDCEVCCRPRTVHVAFEDDGPVVHVSRDD